MSKILIDEATVKLALEGVESMTSWEHPDDPAHPWTDCAKLIRKALAEQPAQPQQEPVACGYDETTGNCTNSPCCYTSPPPAATQHERKPLTDEEINQIADEFIVNYRIPAGSHYDFARAIEAAHGIKE
jgi:hypothetical protein